MNKLKITGKIEEIGELVIINRKDSPPIFKEVLTISTDDDQLLYVDALNKRIEDINSQDITKGSIVEIQYSFRGSQFEDKKFNNIFCEKIKKVQ